MGDDHDSGMNVPESRAPWERPLADSSYRDAHTTGRRRRPPPETQQPNPTPPPRARRDSAPSARRDSAPSARRDSGRIGRRSPQDATEATSVADLVKKVDDEDRTEVIPAVGEQTPGPPPAEPAEPDWAADNRETTVIPQSVGNSSVTRLAMNRIRRRRRLRVAGRTAVALVAVMALVCTGVVWGYLRSTEGKFEQIAALDMESTDIVDAGGQLGDETYLIVGSDTRAGASGNIGAGTVADAEGARADTVMLVNIPADRSRVVAVSFPRDLNVERPVCQAWDNQAGEYTDETYAAADDAKLNATYALGGPKCLVKVIQKLSGLKIGHFVGMDFAGFEAMVNEIGGVEICTTRPLVDNMLGTILPETGTQRLDGHTALNFVRARHVPAEGTGDYGRIIRQQKFLSSLLRGALSNDVLLNPGKLNGFIDAFTRDTFVENIDTKSLLTLGRSLQNVDAGAVTFLTVPTAGTTDWGNEIPRIDDIEAIFQAIIDDEPLPGEERPNPTTPPEAEKPVEEEKPSTAAAVDPSTVSVQVSNASGVSGLAGDTADNLAAYGFEIFSVGNYTESSQSTRMRYAPGHEADAVSVASAIPGAVLESVKGFGSTVELVLGGNFSGTVTDPAAVGTVLDATPDLFGNPVVADIPEDLAVVNAADTTCG
ncbi:MAG: LytR family transcriptional regulator [Rhodococcus sp.]|nr:LytR family transcriptional regulator [Rhodococcus sp. (in: high G+C Gram-positive bacteria)]